MGRRNPDMSAKNSILRMKDLKGHFAKMLADTDAA